MNDYTIHQGVDLHKKFLQIHSINERTGEVIVQRLPNDEKKIRFFMAQFKEPIQVGVEATRNWYWFVDLLQEMGIKVSLSNPIQTKAIAYARVKNDKVDAQTLAHLLRTDLLPTCWIPEGVERNLREILRFRMKMVHTRTQLKNLVRSYLAKQNLHSPYENIWRGKGRKWLEKAPLKTPHKEMLQESLKQETLLSEIIETWEKKIRDMTKQTLEVRIVESLPGGGFVTALTIITETGPIKRFPSAKRYVAYVGLAPKTHGSGDKYKSGHLCKQANLTLKWAFIEVATGAVKKDTALGDYYFRITRKKGKSVAKVAVARKIAKMVYYMLMNGIDYEGYLKKVSGGRLSRVSS